MALTSRALNWVGILILLLIAAGATCLCGCQHFHLITIEKVQIGGGSEGTNTSAAGADDAQSADEIMEESIEGLFGKTGSAASES